MKKLIQSSLFFLFISTTFFSCVPKRQLDDMASKYSAEKAKSSDLQKKNIDLEGDNDKMKSDIEDYSLRMTALKRDTTVQGKSLRQLTTNYDQLDKTYNELLNLQNKINSNNQREIKRYMAEIEKTRIDLQEKEDKLNELTRTLEEKEASLNKLSQDLVDRERKVAELSSIINKQDSAQKALRKKIEDALFGFKDKGLTVHMKDGKIYVSLENQMLFKSGSWNVDGKGKDAIKKLAEVLNENTDINIAVEGHTDIDKYKGKGQLKDNWDLSVIRATQIVKLLESQKVDPTRLTASGRGEHTPLEAGKTAEAKEKNRRIEIILTPKLDELWNELNK